MRHVNDNAERKTVLEFSDPEIQLLEAGMRYADVNTGNGNGLSLLWDQIDDVRISLDIEAKDLE